MPRKALGDRPLTAAERQARQRMRRIARATELHIALVLITQAKTIHEARRIATDTLERK